MGLQLLEQIAINGITMYCHGDADEMAALVDTPRELIRQHVITMYPLTIPTRYVPLIDGGVSVRCFVDGIGKYATMAADPGANVH